MKGWEKENKVLVKCASGMPGELSRQQSVLFAELTTAHGLR